VLGVNLNMTFEAGSGVTDPTKLYVHYAAMFTNYLGGSSSEPICYIDGSNYSRSSMMEDQRADFYSSQPLSKDRRGDVIWFSTLGVNRQNVPLVIDVAGRPDETFLNSATYYQFKVDPDLAQIPGIAVLHSIMNLHTKPHITGALDNQVTITAAYETRANTLCLPARQHNFNPRSGKYDIVDSTGYGPLGDPQCGTGMALYGGAQVTEPEGALISLHK
jgi:hypothetical protein